MTRDEHTKKVNEFEDICFKLRDLYDAKNFDYDDSFGKSFQKFGLTMSAIRLSDKLNRLESFIQHNTLKVTDEPIEDTVMDIANYAIMTLIELHRQKNQKSPGEEEVAAQ